jgi:phosphoribosylaminoimidazole-succinocarboxamide synthase
MQNTYESRLAAGQDPEPLDKDFVRRYYTALDYRGDGEPPPLPNDVRVGAAKRYIEAYERITGQEFIPNTEPPLARIKANLGLS